MRVGILGGTFNPIHLGHLVAAEWARQEYRLDKILFIPCAIPPHKAGKNLADPQIRLRMIGQAIAGNPAFEASAMEIRRGGKSYSYDTLQELHRACQGKDRFWFLVGADSLEHILSWHRIRDLMKLCRLIVVERPGFEADRLLAKMKPPDRRYFGRHILKGVQVGISSHQIRGRVKKGLSVRYMVSEAVESCIVESVLYKG